VATQRIGRAAFTWSDTNHPGTNRQVLLGTRLYNVRPTDQRTRHVADSLDLSVRNVVLFGTSAANVITADVRLHDNPQELVDLIAAGKDGTTLTYYPNLEEPGESYDVYLTAGSVSPDPDTAGWGWYMATMTLRAQSGTLERIMYLDRVLWKYEAGDSLADATFTRATTATYVDIDGTTQTDGAAIDEVRDGHYQEVDGTWTRTLRMEDAESEVLSVPWVHRPQAMTAYFKWVERGMLTTANGSLFWFSNASGTTPTLGAYRSSTNGRLDYIHQTSGATDESRITTGAIAGDVVEGCFQLAASGDPTGYVSVNGGALVTGTPAGTAATLQDDWSAETLWIAQRNGSLGGAVDIERIVIAAGVQSMDHMRSL
jgi:hypothetical protein